jgi:hypothetical protein
MAQTLARSFVSSGGSVKRRKILLHSHGFIPRRLVARTPTLSRSFVSWDERVRESKVSL